MSFKAVITRIKIADNVDFPKLKRLPIDLQNNKNVNNKMNILDFNLFSYQKLSGVANSHKKASNCRFGSVV